MKVWHDKCVREQLFVCSVKKDAMAFTLHNLKYDFWVIFLIWYFHCIYSSKSTAKYFTLSFIQVQCPNAFLFDRFYGQQ